MWKKYLRIGAIGAVVVLLFALVIASVSSKPSNADQVWNEGSTVGDLEARNYYIMYTDLMCPYCTYFSRAVMGHWDEFLAYLEDYDILFEVRLTDYIYEGKGVEASRDAAEASYCAMREGKFWDYYHNVLQSLWDDYQSKGIGTSANSQMIGDLPDDYWLAIGHEVGLGDSFNQCVANHDTLEELEKNTTRALQLAQGMPYFKFNKFVTAGFDPSWGWDYVVRYLDAGLSN